MQHSYSEINKLEVELKILEEPADVPTRPRKFTLSVQFGFA